MLHCLDSSIRIQVRCLNSHALRQMILLRYLMNYVVLHQQVTAKMVASINSVINANGKCIKWCLGYGMFDLKVFVLPSLSVRGAKLTKWSLAFWHLQPEIRTTPRTRRTSPEDEARILTRLGNIVSALLFYDVRNLNSTWSMKSVESI